MAQSRVGLAAWTVTLSLTTAFVVGAVVRPPGDISDMQLSVGVLVVCAPVLAALLSRRGNQWQAIGSLGSFGVYFATLFVCTVALVSPLVFLPVEVGLLTLGFEMLGAAAAFALAVWVCFYGGFWAVIRWVERHVVPDGRSRNA